MKENIDKNAAGIVKDFEESIRKLESIELHE